MDIVWILCFILTVIQTVYCSPCLLVNKRMSITRTIDPSIPFMTWKKGGNTITLAAYDSSSDNCTGPSNTAGYTIYCASGGVYTLEIHNPVNGDLYATVPTTTSLITFVQDPVNIDVSLTPQLTEDKILNKIEIFPVSCSVGCTTPSPYIQWMYQKQDGTQWDIRNMTTSPTSCSSGKWSITDNLDVSYSLINLDDVPFKVFCQVQYSDCDINGISSVSTDYFITFKDELPTTTPDPTTTSKTPSSSETPTISGITLTSETSTISGITHTSETVTETVTSVNHSTTSPGAGKNSSGLTEGAIAGIIVGVIVLIVLIGIAVWCIRKNTDTEDQPPGQPSNIEVSPKTDEICLTWRASGTGGDKQKFIVQHSTDGKTWPDPTTISATSYCIKNLKPDTEYSIQVKAGNAAGYSQPVTLVHIRTKKTKNEAETTLTA